MGTRRGGRERTYPAGRGFGGRGPSENSRSKQVVLEQWTELVASRPLPSQGLCLWQWDFTLRPIASPLFDSRLSPKLALLLGCQHTQCQRRPSAQKGQVHQGPRALFPHSPLLSLSCPPCQVHLYFQKLSPVSQNPNEKNPFPILAQHFRTGLNPIVQFLQLFGRFRTTFGDILAHLLTYT